MDIQLQRVDIYIIQEYNTHTHTHTDCGRLWRLRVGCTALGPICRCKMPFIFHRVREIPDRRGVYLTLRCGGPRTTPHPPTNTVVSSGMTGRRENLRPLELPRTKVRCTATLPYVHGIYTVHHNRAV